MRSQTIRYLSALVLTTALALPFAGPAFAEGPVSPMITVTGEGTVQAAPDTATLSIGVTTQAETAKAAMDANSTALTAVFDRLKAAGIADRDMQTSNLSVNPNWSGSYDNGSAPTITGYVAVNQVNVRIRDLANLGAVVDAAVSDGANTLNGLTFGLDQPKPVLDEARKAAVADAMARAKLLVEAAGGTLGKIVSISESGGYAAPGPMFKADASAMAAPVAQGEVGMSASVTMVFEIKQ